MRTTQCTTHCAACGRCFTSLTAFDAHRAGSHRLDTRHCVDPASVTGKMAMVGVPAVCRIAHGQDNPQPCTLWAVEQFLSDTSLRGPERPVEGDLTALQPDQVS